MKKLSLELLSQAVITNRKSQNMTQADLSVATGINRSILSRLESQDYTPSVDQLISLSEVLGFDVASVLTDDATDAGASGKDY